MMQYFEDMPLGMRVESTETYTFTAEEIKAYASKWDPMPFHIDEALAAQTPLGKLFACSTHVISAGVKLAHTIMDKEVAAVAGLGWNDVRFPRPVLVGDTLKVVTEVVDRRESRSKPDRGIVTTQCSLINQEGDLMAEYKIATLVLKRPR
ncbi:MAG: MaoC family dehydratase N-terminal domain-containing protein [Pseudomonadales bacterium]|nr:MaoC family dehydratase N-terminal domain-containing protein [Pseudomonadales bacterium]